MKTFILGAGDHAKVVYHALRNQREIDGFIDLFRDRDFNWTIYDGVHLIGGLQSLNDILKIEEVQAIVAFGDNKYRKQIFEMYKDKLTMINVIQQSAELSSNVLLGKGIFIGPRTLINNDVTIGDNSIVNSGTIVEHDCKIGRHVHIGPGATIAGNTVIKSGAFIGTGSIIVDDIEIGENTIIGAGAVVTRDLPANCTAVGVPAKPIKFHEHE